MSQGQNHTRTTDTSAVSHLLSRSGTVFADTCKPMTSGNSVGGRVPQPFARNLGLADLIGTECVDTYVNQELGVVILNFDGIGQLPDELEEILK